MWVPPDIEKLAHEVKLKLTDPVAVRAIGVSVVVRYGHDVLRKVYERVRKMLIFDDQSKLKDNIAELFRSSNSIRKRTKRNPIIDWHVVAVTSAPEKTHEAGAKASRLRWRGSEWSCYVALAEGGGMYTVDHGGFNTFNAAFTVVRDDGTHAVTFLGQRYSVASAKSVCQSHHRSALSSIRHRSESQPKAC